MHSFHESICLAKLVEQCHWENVTGNLLLLACGENKSDKPDEELLGLYFEDELGFKPSNNMLETLKIMLDRMRKDRSIISNLAKSLSLMSSIN